MITSIPKATSYDHVIIGGGIAADKAARAIRAVDPAASVLIISADMDPPVYRPALSKDLWLKQDATLAGHLLGTGDIGVELLTGVSASGIDPAAHIVEIADGPAITYGKLLLATGAQARHFPGAPDDPRINYYRSVADYRQLKQQLGPDPGSQDGGHCHRREVTRAPVAR